MNKEVSSIFRQTSDLLIKVVSGEVVNELADEDVSKSIDRLGLKLLKEQADGHHEITGTKQSGEVCVVSNKCPIQPDAHGYPAILSWLQPR